MALLQTWICKNPRCFVEISFGDYCSDCKKLAIRRSIPDSIICEKCGKEVKISTRNPNSKTKKRYCSDCYGLVSRKRSYDFYHGDNK